MSGFSRCLDSNGYCRFGVREDASQERSASHPSSDPLRGPPSPSRGEGNAGAIAHFIPHFRSPMHCRIRPQQKLSSVFATALAPPLSFSHPVAREGRSAGDLAATGYDRAGYSGGADYSPGPGHGALSMPARPGPKHRLAPKTRTHRGLWQNGHAGRQPSSKRYFYFPTPGDGPAPRSLPAHPHRRALQPAW